MNSMFLNEITINEVAKEITKLNPKKEFWRWRVESKSASMYCKLYKWAVNTVLFKFKF